MLRTLIATALLTIAAQPALADAHSAAQLSADIVDLNGKNAGSAIIRSTPSGQLLLTISATGLTQGWHSLHVHETGACDPAEGFKSAGGHLADGKKHGFLVDGGPHPGDMPNQMVQADGQMVADVTPNEALTMDMMLDDDGSAIMIHSGRDDYESQPAGDAGDRVACGVLKKAAQ